MALSRIWWRIPTTTEEAYRRAGGRARLNKQRKEEAERRRDQAQEMAAKGLSKATIAQLLGVHLSSVYRYLEPDKGISCPVFSWHKYEKK